MPEEQAFTQRTQQDFDPQSTWERCEHVMVFPGGDGYALHDMKADVYYYLPGEVAMIIWEACDGVTPLAAMHARITEEFEVDPETAWSDLCRFLDQLEAEGLIKRQPMSSGAGESR